MLELWDLLWNPSINNHFCNDSSRWEGSVPMVGHPPQAVPELRFSQCTGIAAYSRELIEETMTPEISAETAASQYAILLPPPDSVLVGTGKSMKLGCQGRDVSIHWVHLAHIYIYILYVYIYSYIYICITTSIFTFIVQISILDTCFRNFGSDGSIGISDARSDVSDAGTSLDCQWGSSERCSSSCGDQSSESHGTWEHKSKFATDLGSSRELSWDCGRSKRGIGSFDHCES